VRFNRRMCGSREVLRHFSAISSTRAAFDQQEELGRIRELLLAEPVREPSGWNYSRALIGLKDAVFPLNPKAWPGRERSSGLWQRCLTGLFS